jgi:serine-type anaerobic sulfatase-maturating enzyme
MCFFVLRPTVLNELRLAGLSIDGPRELHDTYRVDKGGKGSFDRVMRGLAALRRHGVD